ncbi:DUF4352 domain-containing protein [Streptomyces sp. NPDC005407]|uniref:DUF4352 domain-containing protein n=1 Tax=Streptomyces sp. NPDC005407 TaxID=3155340 RepID=UPI0033A87CD4
MKNTGTAVYSDSPSVGARLVDTQGQQFDSTYDDSAAGAGIPGSITIAPGDVGLGFITFEVPTDSKITKVQFAMTSGFPGNTGQWNVPGEWASKNPDTSTVLPSYLPAALSSGRTTTCPPGRRSPAGRDGGAVLRAPVPSATVYEGALPR